MHNVLTGMSCFIAAFVSVNVATSATAALRSSDEYCLRRSPADRCFVVLPAIGDQPATERPPPILTRPGFQASVTVAVVRQEHLSTVSMIALLAGLLSLGCGGSALQQGTEGGSCFPNGTCMAGLACLSHLCVNAGGSDAGPADAGALNGGVRYHDNGDGTVTDTKTN
ncbi:MAG: hypothetical protein WCE75_15490, partial [Terracidiphilus sp.]